VRNRLIFTFIIIAWFAACKIETGYRVDIKPQVDKFNDLFMSFQIFINLDHRGKEVEAENDLNLIYEQFDILRNDVKSMPVPGDEAVAKFHNMLINSVSFTKDVIDNYRQKFRVEISINNLEAEYQDLSDKLEITKRNFQTAQTAGGKITYRERIVTFQKELEDSKKNLETTRAMYIDILSKIISAEDYYKMQYPEIVKIGKTSVMLSLFPPPDFLISLAERTKYFPPSVPETEEK
jgi:hypothetical protein